MKKLLKKLIKEQQYTNRLLEAMCEEKLIDISGITPPPGEPEDEEPDN